MHKVLRQLRRAGVTPGTVVWVYVHSYGGAVLLGQFVYSGRSLLYIGFHGGEKPVPWKDVAAEFKHYNKRTPRIAYVEVGQHRGPAYYAD